MVVLALEASCIIMEGDEFFRVEGLRGITTALPVSLADRLHYKRYGRYIHRRERKKSKKSNNTKTNVEQYLCPKQRLMRVKTNAACLCEGLTWPARIACLLSGFQVISTALQLGMRPSGFESLS